MLIKVLETSIRSKVLRFLDENEIFSRQHGFIKKKLCFTSLCQLLMTGPVQLIEALELMSRIWTLAKLLIQHPTRDFFKSWLAMVLVVNNYHGSQASCQIVVKGWIFFQLVPCDQGRQLVGGGATGEICPVPYLARGPRWGPCYIIKRIKIL